jgi:hypothetical protein
LAAFAVTAVIMIDRMHDEERNVAVPGGKTATESGSTAPFRRADSGGPPPSPPPVSPLRPPVVPPPPAAGTPPAARPDPWAPGKQREREEAARRQALEAAEAAKKKQRKMFFEIIGPTLDPARADQVSEIYLEYYSERHRRCKKAATEAIRVEAETGVRPEIPEKDEIFAQVRKEAYEKLAKVLDPEELATFRKWWEEECEPKRD